MNHRKLNTLQRTSSTILELLEVNFCFQANRRQDKNTMLNINETLITLNNVGEV